MLNGEGGQKHLVFLFEKEVPLGNGERLRKKSPLRKKKKMKGGGVK